MRAVIGACGHVPMSVGIRQMNTPLDISISGRDIVVSYLRIRDNNPLARVRQREIVRSLEHKLKPLGSVVTDAQCCSMRVTVPSNSSARRVNAVLGALLVQVTRIVQQPCTPKNGARAIADRIQGAIALDSGRASEAGGPAAGQERQWRGMPNLRGRRYPQSPAPSGDHRAVAARRCR